MLSTINIKLDTEEKLSYQKGSLFHGLLMERIGTRYAEKLHEQGLKPYTQRVYKDGENMIWQINSLNSDAYEHIILPVLKEDYQSVELKHNNCKISFAEKNLITGSYQKLVDTYYLGECPRYIHIRFVTPTSFKRDGRYVFYPDLSLLYQSLMKKYDAFADKQSMKSEEVYENLIEYSEITRYDLKSTLFYLEGAKIPSFVGKIVIRIKGPQPLVNLVHLLFRYGEYSGIGIKTALGMGMLQVIEKEDR